MAEGRRWGVGSKLKDNGLETARAYRTEMGITDGLNFHNTARYELLLNRDFMRGASHKAIRYVYTREYWGNSVTKRRDYLRWCTLLSTAISHHQTSIYFDKRTINLGFNLPNVSFGSNTKTTFHKQIEHLYGHVVGVNSVQLGSRFRVPNVYP